MMVFPHPLSDDAGDTRKSPRCRRRKPARGVGRDGDQGPFLGPRQRGVEQRELEPRHERIVHDVNAVAVRWRLSNIGFDHCTKRVEELQAGQTKKLAQLGTKQ